jgi:putative membrane protein insertion efficiency factor
MPGRLLVLLLRAYRASLSPLFGGACRFHPSCSAYWIEAIERHGAARGAALGVRRVLRCRPWGDSGFDPVPDVQARPRGSANAESAS